ncbi:MAG: hypothetical protein U0359_22810 [Byssovorax sp.]
MLGDASLQEAAFVGILMAIVLLASLAPKIGERIGALFEDDERKGGDGVG